METAKMVHFGTPSRWGTYSCSTDIQALIFSLKAWYTENLQISVPVTVVAGLFIIIMVTCCFKGMDGVAPLSLTNADGIFSGFQASQREQIETVFNRTRVCPDTR